VKDIEAPGLVIPGIEDITRRDFLIGGAAALLLGGCGSDGESAGETSGETRTVEHMFGTTEVPAEPKRVAALFVTVASALASVGVQPIAVVEDTVEFVEPLRGLLDPDINLSESEEVGSVSEFSLERLATLEPDLIVGTPSASR
jgi:iron complex transport system substrate-binding protein